MLSVVEDLTYTYHRLTLPLTIFDFADKYIYVKCLVNDR